MKARHPFTGVTPELGLGVYVQQQAPRGRSVQFTATLESDLLLST